jgi:hypothetical protein
MINVDDVTRVREHLAAKKTEDQLVSFITRDIDMPRNRVLAALRELERQGTAIRLHPGGWVLKRYKGARTSELERAILDGPFRWGRAPAMQLIKWIDEQPDPIDRKELLARIDIHFPDPLAEARRRKQ